MRPPTTFLKNTKPRTQRTIRMTPAVRNMVAAPKESWLIYSPRNPTGTLQMAVRSDPEKLRPITNPRQIKLGDADAARPRGLSKRGLKKAVKQERKRIQKMQPVFYADGRFALLVVFQGRDASGKDGVIRKVFRGV